MKSISLGVMLATLLFFALLACSRAQPRENYERFTFPQECRNRTLTNTLSNITSDSCIELPQGIHRLTDLQIVNVSNVTIYGADGPEHTIITCSEGVGLVFVECSDVSLKKITISNCSLTGENLMSVMSRIERSTHFLFDIPQELNISLFLGSCEDIELQNIIVKDTAGLGLLAINVLGQFVISESSFLRNVPKGCFFINSTNTDAGVGGGAIIVYHETESSQLVNETTLKVTNAVFFDNSNCGISSKMLVYSTSRNCFPQDCNGSYVLGGGGGLTLLMSMYRYRLNVYIDQVIFQNNTARFGGGMFIGYFTAVSNMSMIVRNSTFESNGLNTSVDLTDPSFSIYGAAVTVVTDIVRPKNTSSLRAMVKTGRNELTFINTRFLGNTGYSAGAVLIYALYTQVPNGNNDHIIMKSCVFDGNRAYLGAVARLHEHKHRALQEGLNIEVQDTNFTSNQLLSLATGGPNIDNIGSTSRSSGIVELFTMKLTLTGNNLFSDNSGTAIRSDLSLVEIDGEATFKNNSGSYGGSLGFTGESFLLVKNNSFVKIINNHAYISGGGIYTQHHSATFHYYDCFLFFDTVDLYCELNNDCPDLRTLNITISFHGNRSPLGSVVYGSTLQTCPWLDNNSNIEVFKYLKEVGIFEFYSPVDNNSFNTLPDRMEILQRYNGSVMPGQTATFSLVAYDRFNHAVPDPITSTVIKVDHGNPETYQAVLGASGYWFLNEGPNGSSVPITFQSTVEIPDDSVNVSVGIYSKGSTESVMVNFSLKRCYPGFVFSNTSSDNYSTCECDQLLKNDTYNIECNSTSAQITVNSGKWVGFVNTAENDETRLAIVNCPLDYCNSGVKIVTNGIFDSQCSTHFYRRGIACGQCVENYSVVIGSNRCQHCSNLFLLLLLLFAVCGVVTLYIITRSNFTVSTGYFNSWIFYSNIVALYKPYFLPDVRYYGVLSPILFWNLELGFETCFYNGMTPIKKAYLHFVFPIYLWIVMAVYVTLGHLNIGRIRKNAPSAIASLLLLCYVSTLESCITALSFLKVDGVGLRWLVDPSINYFQGKHLPLGVFSVAVILIYIVPFPILISVPSLTLRTSLGKRFLPICDAFWAAYNPKFHFWEAIRMLLRIGLFLTTILLPSPLNGFILGVACVGMTLATAICFPYKNHSVNIFEIFLLLDLLLIVQGVLYFASSLNITEHNSKESVSVSSKLVIFTCMCLIPVYITIVAFKIYYILKAHPKMKLVLLKMLPKCLRKRSKILVKPSFPKKDDDNAFEMDTHPRKVLHYADLREPLLDDPEVSDKPLSIVCDD